MFKVVAAPSASLKVCLTDWCIYYDFTSVPPSMFFHPRFDVYNTLNRVTGSKFRMVRPFVCEACVKIARPTFQQSGNPLVELQLQTGWYKQFLQHEGPLRSFELQFSLGMRMHCNSITVVLFLNYSSFSWEYHCFIHNSIWFFIHSYWWLVSYIHCWISVSGYSSNLWLHLSFYRWILYSLVNPRVLCHHSDDLYWRRPQFY